jgi:hypothetical protein
LTGDDLGNPASAVGLFLPAGLISWEHMYRTQLYTYAELRSMFLTFKNKKVCHIFKNRGSMFLTLSCVDMCMGPIRFLNCYGTDEPGFRSI